MSDAMVDLEAYSLALRKAGDSVRFGPWEYRVLYDRLLVQRLETTEETEGGIRLPQMALQQRTEGIVLATGEGRLMSNGEVHRLLIRPGDRVVFHSAQGIDMSEFGERLILLREDEILASRRETAVEMPS